MHNEIIFYVEDSMEGGFEARALGYPIFTQGDTKEDLINNIKDAVECHFEPEKMPHIIKFHYVREEVIAI